MPNETLPAYSVLMDACKGAGLHPVGTTCDGGVIVEEGLDAARVAEAFGRLVPLQAGLTIVYGKRS